ncbi:GroEL equatorial domain-like protein, partial [Auricularia subglabra TFB-10046 SS5]
MLDSRSERSQSLISLGMVHRDCGRVGVHLGALDGANGCDVDGCLHFCTLNGLGALLGVTRVHGQDVRDQNVLAAQSIANIVKSSLGPLGLDKMMVDSIGEVTISNDGATIMSLLNVENPAGRIFVELAQKQDKEVGDGTTSVVLIAAELLRRANELVKQKIHPTTIITGYRQACREACKFMTEQLSVKVDALGRDALINAAKTSMSSKIINECHKAEGSKTFKYPVKAVNVLQAHGKSARDSIFLKGFALNCTVASQGAESEITLERIRKILAAGANVVFTTKGIDDLCLKSFVEAGAMAVRRCKKEDLRRLAKAAGATMVSDLTSVETGEVFDASNLGTADEVVQERISDD